ncbi:response regulator transcription factor [Halobacillus litoralis]|uniref:response regulator transcription factor n=1 Tax=Halobacillus litoralis TaxID=45668 RepID=UPI001CD20DE2|nr:response regulator transcription factor [Halobacillus litoralis]MCA1023811.1 response regulator transcription factor [Halobacillus litoralis]
MKGEFDMSQLHKVLVVDDEMLIRQGIINYIDWEREGFKIVGEASNGCEALKLIEDLKPDLLITDVVMPEMNGIDLVRMAKETYPSMEIIVLSSFENFDYVRSTFQIGITDYILKPKLNGEELIQTLKKVAPQSEASKEEVRFEPSIEELLQKHLSGGRLTRAENEKLEMLPEGVFHLLAIPQQKKEWEEEFLHEVKNRIEDQDEQNIVTGLPISESGLFVGVILQNTNDSSTANETILSIVSDQQAEGDRPWMLSSPFTYVHEMKNVYEHQLLVLKEYSFYLFNYPILVNGNLPTLDQNKHSFDLNQFIQRFKHKEFNAALNGVKQHLEWLSRDYTLDVFEFKSWMENVIFNTIVLLGNMKYNVNELENEKYEYFSEINEAVNVEEACAPFYHFMNKVKNIVTSDKEQGGQSESVRRLLEYINNHYSEPLSLTTLADYFHFNPSYLSSYFSTHLEVGFVDYLNKIRIERAMEFLETTSNNISEISEMVGYSDPSYFSKVFKRVTGYSPGKYRKKTQSVKIR